MWRDKIASDAKQALLAGDRRKAEALRFLVSLLDKEATKKLVDRLEEAEELKILQKELKNKEESLSAFLSAGREELVEEVKQEIEWLASYLPKGLSEEEVAKLVEELVSGGELQFGVIMKKVMSASGGRIDGLKLATIVKQKLNQL